MTVPPRWPAQEEALQFALERPACMLDMEMGTGKTRVAIDSIMARPEVGTVLVVCPKAVMGVWPRELAKYAEEGSYYTFQRKAGETVLKTSERLWDFMNPDENWYQLDDRKRVIVINYDSVWRKPLGDYLVRLADHRKLDMVVLDESHRAKAAGSKVSKYLAMLGRRVPVRMCLSGTPMANSPLDVYGQYRFLDRSIFGTNFERFRQQYAVLGGPERKFVVGYKNQQELMERFRSVAYTCRMSDVADRIKLPEAMPPVRVGVQLPARDMATLAELGEEFVAECAGGFVTASNVLVRMLRMQQICAGFCPVQDAPLQDAETRELNTAKADALRSILQDLPPDERVVVFCVFQHDLDEIRRVALLEGRPAFELSGREHTLDRWFERNGERGGVIAVQIQAGAEGVDMTRARHAVYFSLPHSLALYDQSKARLYRPGQDHRVSFLHLVAEDTIDEAMYESLQRKRDVIDAIRDGSFDFGYMKR
jgi:SNF2 family DNA or RNA helicase